MSRAWLLSFALAGCGATRPAAADAGGFTDDGGFGLVHHTGLQAGHLASCTSPQCGEAANPPLGGPHCPTPSSCEVFGSPVPRCEWLHNLEHGHVVLAYNCPSGCADAVAGLSAVWQQARDSGNTRVLVTPDPLLPTRVAAMVWGWGWTGDSVDLGALHAVMSHQDQDAPEAGVACAP